MSRHRGEGQASNEGRDHHIPKHARSGVEVPPGLAPEQQPTERGESLGRYDR